jgi:hypothetical protein
MHFDETEKPVKERKIPLIEENTNSTVDDRERRDDLLCSFCRPNRGENAKRRPKHGKTKPKKKDHRR